MPKSSMDSQVELSSVLMPSLLNKILDVSIPWPLDATLDFNEVADRWSGKSGDESSLYDLCIPTLKALSTLGLANIPDLMQYLPPPQSATFPTQALALQILIDQGPRQLKGRDKRWCNSYFDIISLDLAHKFAALPESVQPYRKDRWVDEMGASFDNWAVAQIWFLAPWMHSEALADHEAGALLVETWRREVEMVTGSPDPHRANKNANSKDTLAFSRLFLEDGIPSHPGLKMEEFLFWWALVMDVHKPILDAFGRYPYRNSTQGRESTPQEITWLEETKHFGEADAETVALIKSDIQAGIWAPLNGC